MATFDPSQQRVRELDPRRHARVIGAPGTGKTHLFVESYLRCARLSGWSPEDVLALGTSRLVAAELRQRVVDAWAAPLSGSPVRTAQSYAFSILRRVAAESGAHPPRLLTGAVHDEMIAIVIEDQLREGRLIREFSDEVVRSAPFRAELREFSRILDAYGPEARDRVRHAGSFHETRTASPSHGPAPEFVTKWQLGYEILDEVEGRLARLRPGELSSSRMLAEAANVLVQNEGLRVPRLVLIDDGQELGEGELRVLAALAARGARVWAFGDPDQASGVFRGERSRLIAGIVPELARVGVKESRGGNESDEQLVVLDTVHRHGTAVRDFVRGLSNRVGAFGLGQQRAAVSAYRESSDTGRTTEPPGSSPEGAGRAASERVCDGRVEFARATTGSEQLGMIGNRMRRRRLGLDGQPAVPWSEMAVICRSRAEAVKIARVLASHRVPTDVSAGGVVLREHQLVRELIRLMKHVLGIEALQSADISDLLGGTVGGLDPVALRRFRGSLRLREDHEARTQGREPAATNELIAEGFFRPGPEPLMDSRGARRLHRLGLLTRAASTTLENGGSPREVLWALWEGARLAEPLQRAALTETGAAAAEAHRALDAVTGLFFAFQRHEEQASEQTIGELLADLERSTVPEDSVAAQSQREVVTVTTPQGTIGREFDVVCLVGLQEGAWPNLRARGLMLGVQPFERWLRGMPADAPSRRDTLHDELRLFVLAASRARSELFAVAVSDDEQHPSTFFGFGAHTQLDVPPPSGRLTLRGAVGEMRRRLTENPDDEVALASLTALIEAGVPGAHPDEWYGLREPTTTAPLRDLSDPDELVRVNPSSIETAETCPLDWAISQLGGGEQDLSASIGSLLHRALELLTDGDRVPEPQELSGVVEANWKGLKFEAGWQEAEQRWIVSAMAESLAEYLRDFAQSGRELIGREQGFEVQIGPALLTGTADRLEAWTDENGERRVSVVDLKTGKSLPKADERETHAQLQAYQLGVRTTAFASERENEPWVSGGARLLCVHPKVQTVRGPNYREVDQSPMTAEREAEFRARVLAAAETMAAASFTARVEHHCTKEFSTGGSCRLHIIPAVSHQ